MVENGEHYRPESEEQPPGVYRVVGSADDVVLLHLADGDGRRINSGRLVTAGTDKFESDFEPATNPDAGFTPIRSLHNALSGLYWSVRRFL